VIKKLLLNTDGGSRGNPGPAAYGYVIQDITPGAGMILEKCGNYLGITTNNVAEYEGLLAGVSWVVEHHPTAELLIKMDSLLIVNQIKGLFKVKNPGLLPKYQAVRGLLAKLPQWSIAHLSRGNSPLTRSSTKLWISSSHAL
jgi:probable phosphoglycerate mutase